jgi:hypothetical protein
MSLVLMPEIDSGRSPFRAPAIYERLETNSEIGCAAAQSLVLASTSDAVSQWLRAVPLDTCHVFAMGITASVLSGACNAVWLRILEELFPGSHSSAVVCKSLADFCVCAPCVLSGYLVLVPLLTLLFGGADAAALQALGGWTQESFASAMLLNLCTFQPYNIAQFALIPPHLRPLGGACVSASSTVVLSAITLGYTFEDVIR